MPCVIRFAIPARVHGGYQHERQGVKLGIGWHEACGCAWLGGVNQDSYVRNLWMLFNWELQLHRTHLTVTRAVLDFVTAYILLVEKWVKWRPISRKFDWTIS